MHEKIKISVIVPVYNEIKYLEACVSSICGQSYQNLEIILVDDGSDAPCYELCDTLSQRDSRIKVIHKENGGSLSARKKGIEEASGTYVAFVDSDDWIEAELYTKIAEMIIKYEPDMITASNYYRNYENGFSMSAHDNKRAGFWKRSQFEESVFPFFIKTNDFFDTEFPISMWAYLFKTDFAHAIVQKIGENIKTSEDYTFLVLAFLHADSFAAVSYRGHHYRSNVNSKTHTLKNMKKLLCPVYQTIDNAIERSEFGSTTKEILKKKNRLHMYHALMLKDYQEVVKVTSDFLFPYRKVRKGSQILIYGAGKLGKQIYGAVNSTGNYKIVAMADKSWKSHGNVDFDVIAPEDILSFHFDFIIIAISYANVKNQVKKDLIEMGIDEGKIAEVDLDILNKKYLSFIMAE